MSEALQEARAYRDPINESKLPRQLKNPSKETMVVKNNKTIVIDKSDLSVYMAKGWQLAEGKFTRYSDLLVQKGRMQRAGDKQGERLTDIEIEKEKKKLNIKDEKEEELEEAFTKADFDKLEADNQHGEAAKKLVDQFGTPEEKKEIDAINKRHKQTGYIKGPDYQRRYQITNKYYSRLR